MGCDGGCPQHVGICEELSTGPVGAEFKRVFDDTLCTFWCLDRVTAYSGDLWTSMWVSVGAQDAQRDPRSEGDLLVI